MSANGKISTTLPANAARISGSGDEEFRKMGGEELAVNAILGSKGRQERARQELARRAWNDALKRRDKKAARA